MCRMVRCRVCGRPGWRGCGAHVEQVLGHVPPAERCTCADAPAGAGGGLHRRRLRLGRSAPGGRRDER